MMMTIKNLKKLYTPLLAVACGVIGSFAFPPYNIFLLGLISYASLFCIIHTAPSKKKAMAYGLLWGVGFHVGGLWWIAEALLVEGNPYKWAYPLAVIGLPFILSMFIAIVAVSYKVITGWAKIGVLPASTLFVLLLASSEWLRGHVFTGFPWNLPAYIWSEQLEVLQALSWLGAYGLSTLTLLLSVLLGVAALQKTKPSILAALCISLVFITLYCMGAYRLTTNEGSTKRNSTLNIRIIQPNIPQADKWVPSKYIEHLTNFRNLAIKDIPDDSAETTLLILPETALNDVMMSSKESVEIMKDIAAAYKKKSQEAYLLAGTLRSHISETQERNYFNSALLYDNNGYIIDSYDKSHLVPFGEYMPLSDIIDLDSIVGFSGFKAGKGVKTIDAPSIPTIGVAICYEIIFPGRVIDKNNKPEILITLTNDAWYGDTPGPYQHYMMARYRAIEEHIPVIRSGNTGISGGFDMFGREIATLPLQQQGIVTIQYFHKKPNLK